MNQAIIRVIARSEAERAMRKGGLIYYLQTENDSEATIATLEVEDFNSGLLEVEIVGVDDDQTGDTLTVKQIVRFKKTETLTLGTPADILALETEIPDATFSISNVDDDIAIKVTGGDGVVVNWVCKVKMIQVIATTPAA